MPMTQRPTLSLFLSLSYLTEWMRAQAAPRMMVLRSNVRLFHSDTSLRIDQRTHTARLAHEPAYGRSVTNAEHSGANCMHGVILSLLIMSIAGDPR